MGIITKEEFLELWRRILPEGYTVPIEEEANGQGLDIFAQQAAQFARVSEAANRSQQAYFLKPHSTQTDAPAAGAQAATGSVNITRVAPAVGDLLLQEGTELEASTTGPTGEAVLGPRYFLTADVTMPGGSLGPVAASIQAVRPGYQGNVRSGRITVFAPRGTAAIPAATVGSGNVVKDGGIADRFALSMIGQFVQFTSGANSTTFPRRIVSVTQGSPISSAILDGPALVVGAATLDVLEFADLGLTIAQPVATSGGVHGWLDAIGRDRRTDRKLGESDATYQDRLCALEDVVSPGAIQRTCSRILSPFGIAFRIKEVRDGATYPGFVLDFSPFDFGDIPGGSVVLPETRFFVICVAFGNQGEFGAPYDSPHPDNALDFLFLDGFPVVYNGLIGALFDAVDRARASGVGFVIVQDPDL